MAFEYIQYLLIPFIGVFLWVKQMNVIIDRNVESAIQHLKFKGVDIADRFNLRAKAGLEKYKVTTEREDLTEKQWVIHAIEEAMDAIVYLVKLSTINKKMSCKYVNCIYMQSDILIDLLKIEEKLKNDD